MAGCLGVCTALTSRCSASVKSVHRRVYAGGVRPAGICGGHGLFLFASCFARRTLIPGRSLAGRLRASAASTSGSVNVKSLQPAVWRQLRALLPHITPISLSHTFVLRTGRGGPSHLARPCLTGQFQAATGVMRRKLLHPLRRIERDDPGTIPNLHPRRRHRPPTTSPACRATRAHRHSIDDGGSPRQDRCCCCCCGCPGKHG